MICAQTIQHIIGSAFSWALVCDESPVLEGGVALADTSGWQTELELVRSGSGTTTIAGSWISSTAPAFRMLFAQADTTSWQPGHYALRLKLTAPDGRVFRPELALFLEVKR